MPLYVIGDLQGCYSPLRRLLDQVRFDPATDELWFTGDLVNRGPESLEALRFVHSLGPRATTVLGNHDLHLLAVAFGPHKPKKKDTMEGIFAAPDRDELLEWLIRQPLLHYDPDRNLALVHAGIHPFWSLQDAIERAAELEAVLTGEGRHDYFEGMYGNHPPHWHDQHQGLDRLRAITNCFTRMRFCDAEGHLDLKYKGAIGGQPEGFIPWFEHPGRRATGVHILFGHWAALGIYQGENVTGLDSGCVWGSRLTALRLDENGRELIGISCS